MTRTVARILLTALCCFAQAAYAAPKPKVTLTASPKVASAGIRAVEVTLYLVVTDGDERYRCPGVRWMWPDGTESFEEADCDPNEPVPARQSWIKRINVPAGDWIFTVRIEQASKTIIKVSTSVHIV